MITISKTGRFGSALFVAVALLATVGAARSDAAAPADAGRMVTPTSPAASVPGCIAVATVVSQWGAGTPWAGETVNVVVRNISARDSTRWAAAWNPPPGQQVQGVWGAEISVTGTTVTARNPAHNGSLAPGASTSFGMNLTGTGVAPAMVCSSDTDQGVGGHARTVTVADNGSPVTLYVGDTLVVSLPADYDPPTVSGPALSVGRSSGGYPSGQPLLVDYRAVANGYLDVRSQTDYACFHTPPHCARPTQSWVVHVSVVTPFETPSATPSATP